MPDSTILTAAELIELVTEARARTLELTADLSDEQIIGPRLDIVNPPLWEIGHVAWFQEKWVLRHHAGARPLREDADRLYDSAAVPHGIRWDLPLPRRQQTLAYMQQALEAVVEHVQSQDASAELTYFCLLAVFHEDMHAEAITYTRQTHGYPAPWLDIAPVRPRETQREATSRGDVEIPGGTYLLGAPPSSAFVFDNEKWSHAVDVPPFAIGRAQVTNAEFSGFIEEGGYGRPELWSDEGWAWREGARAECPLYWRRDTGRGWLRRHFDRLVALEPDHPVIHVNWYEADAYCRWAHRRLPTEPEWELAASAEPTSDGRHITARKRRFPWGEEPPSASRANLDWRALGCVPVAALPDGDSAFGCRQMIGNVWEWTSTAFGPYPGFVPDPYEQYSEPSFGSHRVLRGGGWATRGRLLRNTWRNFYPPHRRDVWAGFRTCTA